jgi:hypothetical protein
MAQLRDNEKLKDPQDVLDYGCDFSTWLGVDTITASAWTVPSGITADSDTNTTTATTIWLSGGTLGESYRLVNHITTAAGRETDRSIVIKMVAK